MVPPVSTITRPRLANQLRSTLRTALLGPQILAFLPALMLGGYWYGGEGLLLVTALLLPALFAVAGLFSRAEAWGSGRSDAVTGLAFREAAVEYLDVALAEAARGRRSACLVLAIDDAGQAERRLGPAAWDTVLARTAQRLAATLRDGDMVVRLPGATFGVVLQKLGRGDLEMLVQLASRIQSAVAEPISVEAIRVYVTASLGFCLQSRCPGSSGEAFLMAAEIALAEARRNGPGSIRAFTEEMQHRTAARHALVDGIAEAIDSGEIQPWFQPQISTDTGRLTGVEALARWDHPERGEILPGEFLPAVSEAGLDGRLAEAMLFASLAALRSWDRVGLVVPRVGVNFSETLLRDPKLVEKIRWELDRFDLAPERLSVEVLESVISLAEDDTITRNLWLLHEMNCGVDLDDFGTGHASIANIRRFAIDRIKIDRVFVTRVDVDRDQQSMVRAILTMAEQLGCETLAEGVESVGEHSMLAQLGCGHVQGYGVGRPMPAEALERWVRAHHAKLDAMGAELATDIALPLHEGAGQGRPSV